MPHLLTRPEPKVMNIISTAGLRGKANESVYVASKFGVRGFTESLKVEYQDTNLHVTAAYMGGMNTPFGITTTTLKIKAACAQLQKSLRLFINSRMIQKIFCFKRLKHHNKNPNELDSLSRISIHRSDLPSTNILFPRSIPLQ